MNTQSGSSHSKISSWQVAKIILERLLRFTYLDKAVEQDLATSRFTTDVNSSITQLLLSLRAKSALKPSPLDKTCLGFPHVGTLFNPTALNLPIASSTLSK